MIMHQGDMELLLLSLLLLMTLFLSCWIRFSVNKLETARFVNSNLPPGKMGFPFIGETLGFLRTARKGTPEKLFQDRLAKYSPLISKTSSLSEPTVVLRGAAGNKLLFSNENKLVTARWPRSVERVFPSSLQTSANEQSMNMRRLLPGFLKPEALRKYVGIMDSIPQWHLDKQWESNETVTVFPLAKQYTFMVASRLFSSMSDPKKIANFADPFHILAAGIMSFPGSPFNRVIKAADSIRKELRAIIEQRKLDLLGAGKRSSSSKENILFHMLTTADENNVQFMNEMDIADKTLCLPIGGHDTEHAAIIFIIKYLAELPQVYGGVVLKVQMEVAAGKQTGDMLTWEDLQKMKYSWNVASEVMMRLAPPLLGNFREAIADFSPFPKAGSCSTGAQLQHARTLNTSPSQRILMLKRFEEKGPIPNTYVPVGGEPRMCHGKEYARLEILVFMHNVVRRFRWYKLLQKEDIIADTMPMPTPMPTKGLPIRLRLLHNQSSLP